MPELETITALLTVSTSPLYSGRSKSREQSAGAARIMSDNPFKSLEDKIDRLIDQSTRLAAENTALREREASLLRERSKLLEKNEQARVRVEAMISRLRGLDNAEN